MATTIYPPPHIRSPRVVAALASGALILLAAITLALLFPHVAFEQGVVEAQGDNGTITASVVSVLDPSTGDMVDVVRLDWTLPPDIGEFLGYEIDRASGCFYVLNSPMGHPYPMSTTYQDPTIEQGTTYYYWVRAYTRDEIGKQVYVWNSDRAEITVPLQGETASPSDVTFEPAEIADHPQWMRASWTRGPHPEFYSQRVLRFPVDREAEFAIVRPTHGCRTEDVDPNTVAGHPYAIQVQNFNRDRVEIGEPSEPVEGVAAGRPDIRKVTNLHIDDVFSFGTLMFVKLAWDTPVRSGYKATQVRCKEPGGSGENDVFESTEAPADWAYAFPQKTVDVEYECDVISFSEETKKTFHSDDTVEFTVPALASSGS